MTYYYCRKRSEGEKDRKRAKTFKLSDGQTGMSEEVGEGDQQQNEKKRRGKIHGFVS